MRYLLLLLLSLPAQAGELLLHGPSYHFGPTEYNNANYGLGYAFDNNFVLGAYENSINKTSVYAGYCFTVTQRISVLAGAVSGYEIPVAPAVVLSYRVPITERLGLRINLVPFGSGVINLALGVRL